MDDGDAAKNLLTSQNDEGHDSHHQTALKARLLGGPDTRGLQQFGGDRGVTLAKESGPT